MCERLAFRGEQIPHWENDRVSYTLKLRAIDLVSNTIGVNTVVDELAVVKDVKVINAKPTVKVIETTTPVTTETKVIVKP